MNAKLIHPTKWGFRFYCPACETTHVVQINDPGGRNWTYNGEPDRPTFLPSVLVQGTVPVTDEQVDRIMRGENVEPTPLRCHLYVSEGYIKYLDDCSHKMAGQVVPMVPYVEKA